MCSLVAAQRERNRNSVSYTKTFGDQSPRAPQGTGDQPPQAPWGIGDQPPSDGELPKLHDVLGAGRLLPVRGAGSLAGGHFPEIGSLWGAIFK